MKQTILKWCFVAAFFAASITLSLGILFDGPSKAGANEQLSKPPVLVGDDGAYNPDFLSDAAAWLSDHFFLRQELITLHNRLSAVVHTSGAEDVVLGRDGWLYYDSTMDNYTGQNLMTDRELFSAATNLELMANYCREQGKQFLFTIAPNKNSLYWKNMPDTGISNPRQDAENLHKELASRQIPYVDLFALFDTQEEPLYFAHDSHWNSKGAALAADAINRVFGKPSQYFSDPFAAAVPHQGDLYEMLYPAGQDPEQDPVYGGKLHFTYAGAATKPDSITLKTEGSGDDSLFAYRDSFGNLLYPYLADSFSSATFSRSTRYDLTKPSDFVLIELVERNLRYLITNLPVMPAPEREQTLPQTVSGTASFTTVKGPEGYIQIKGTLPTTADTDSRVYLVCGEKTYEAFLTENNSYGAYIPAEETAEKLLFTQNSQTVQYMLKLAN